ncbi:MAG: PDZ domain-containing protein [Nitrospirota bacterium]|nr:PDZ domain-containing protein [Nitrospirota bacterium]
MLTSFSFRHRTSQILKLVPAALLCITAFTPWALAYEGQTGDVAAPTNPHASPPGPNTPMPSGIVGIAMHITAGRIGDPAQLIIRAVHPSGPAARAGLEHGEEIMAVDGESVAGKTYMEVVGLIRGDSGSSVKLGLRGPQGERTLSLMRVSEEILMEQTPPSM